MKQMTLGVDCGIANEFTLNVGDLYQSIAIDSYLDVKKLNKLKKYQKKFNRHYTRYNKNSKSNKKNKTKKVNDSNINNSSKSSDKINALNNTTLINDNVTDNYLSNPVIKNKLSRKQQELKDQQQIIHDNLVQHKKDTVNKLVSLCDNFQAVSFQKELIHSWHTNKTFKFSRIVQAGIRGRVYAQWKFNNINLINSTIYKQIASYERTTKTCLCGKINPIDLDTRVYSCTCGYRNDRDTHPHCTLVPQQLFD